MLLRHSPADDEQIRGEEHLDVGVVALQPLGPLLPRQVLERLLPRGRAGLGVMAVDLQVAELGVGHERAVHDDGRADAGAQRGDDDGAAHALGGAVGDFGQTRGVGVIERIRAPSQDARHELVDIDALPGLVEIGHESNGPVHDRSREGDSDGRIGVDAQLLDDLPAHLGDGLGCGGLRRVDANAVAHELTGLQVDEGALDPRPADVDPARHPVSPTRLAGLAHRYLPRVF